MWRLTGELWERATASLWKGDRPDTEGDYIDSVFLQGTC